MYCDHNLSLSSVFPNITPSVGDLATPGWPLPVLQKSIEVAEAVALKLKLFLKSIWAPDRPPQMFPQRCSCLQQQRPHLPAPWPSQMRVVRAPKQTRQRLSSASGRRRLSVRANYDNMSTE